MSQIMSPLNFFVTINDKLKQQKKAKNFQSNK